MPSRHAISCSWILLTAMALHGCGSGSSAGPQDAAQTAAAPAASGAPLPMPGAYPNLPAPAPAASAPVGAAATAGAASRDVAVAVAVAEPAIEVGCTYDGNQIVGPPGTRKLLNCPAGCAARGWLWGTDHYTTDSAVCIAAIHAGVVPAEGGDVVLIREDGRQAYRGTRRNGVESTDYGAFGSGFRLQRP